MVLLVLDRDTCFYPIWRGIPRAIWWLWKCLFNKNFRVARIAVSACLSSTYPPQHTHTR